MVVVGIAIEIVLALSNKHSGEYSIYCVTRILVRYSSVPL